MIKKAKKSVAIGLSVALAVTSVNIPVDSASAAAKKAKLSATKKTLTPPKRGKRPFGRFPLFMPPAAQTVPPLPGRRARNQEFPPPPALQCTSGKTSADRRAQGKNCGRKTRG